MLIVLVMVTWQKVAKVGYESWALALRVQVNFNFVAALGDRDCLPLCFPFLDFFVE